jgi:glycosyltransferase involved in cell wall biosynthesis
MKKILIGTRPEAIKMAPVEALPKELHKKIKLFTILKKLASSSIDNFIWYGYTNNMIKFWENVDMAIVPSSGPEAFGRVVIEAMIASKPVIATRSGGPDEIIDDNVNGILISMKGRKSLVQNIDRLINNSKERKRLGQGGFNKVKMYFSAQSYSNTMQEYYQEIIDCTNS